MSYFLTIPDQAEALKAVEGKSGDGQGELIDSLEEHPLARSERGKPRHMDHIYLSRFVGTDYCRWYGRCADGWHRPIGRVMQIVEASTSPSDHSVGQRES